MINMGYVSSFLSRYDFSLSFISPPYIFFYGDKLSRLERLIEIIAGVSKITILQFPSSLFDKGRGVYNFLSGKFKIKNYGDNSIYIKEGK
ncbi:MAG: hypothetical protein ACK4NF_02935, partial [Planctomycetota bacterium]